MPRPPRCPSDGRAGDGEREEPRQAAGKCQRREQPEARRIRLDRRNAGIPGDPHRQENARQEPEMAVEIGRPRLADAQEFRSRHDALDAGQDGNGGQRSDHALQRTLFAFRQCRSPRPRRYLSSNESCNERFHGRRRVLPHLRLLPTVPRLPDEERGTIDAVRRHAGLCRRQGSDGGGQRGDRAGAAAAGQGRTRHRQDRAGPPDRIGARARPDRMACEVDDQGAAGPLRI